MELPYETLIEKYLGSWILPSSWDLNFKQTISRINSDSYQILRMEYPDMEFPVFSIKTIKFQPYYCFYQTLRNVLKSSGDKSVWRAQLGSH